MVTVDSFDDDILSSISPHANNGLGKYGVQSSEARLVSDNNPIGRKDKTKCLGCSLLHLFKLTGKILQRKHDRRAVHIVWRSLSLHPKSLRHTSTTDRNLYQPTNICSDMRLLHLWREDLRSYGYIPIVYSKVRIEPWQSEGDEIGF